MVTLEEIQRCIDDIYNNVRPGAIPFRTTCSVETIEGGYVLTVSDTANNKVFELLWDDIHQLDLQTIIENFWDDAEYTLLLMHSENDNI